MTWQWDDEPERLDTLAIWIGADTASIDAAFTVLADAAESAEFAAIIRRHAKGRQSQ
jgi:3-polyprenyl-4-hydroxybenzoate decarboxylase